MHDAARAGLTLSQRSQRHEEIDPKRVPRCRAGVAPADLVRERKAMADRARNPREPGSQPAPGSRAHPGADLTPAGPVTAAQPGPARDRWRFVPMVGWIRSYDRGWLRGDLIAGVDRGGPDRSEEPRLRRDCRDPAAERPLRGRCRRDPLRGLRDEPADLDRAELGIGGRGRERRCGGRDHGTPRCGDLRGDDHPRFWRAVPPPRRAEDGLDRAVPVPGRGDRLPVRRGDRRGDR